jgi:hypothetical protein
MKLAMFIGNKMIDSLPIDPERPVSAGYLGILKTSLEERNEEILDLSGEDPSFFIDNIPSSMNGFTNLSFPGKNVQA